MSTVTTGAESIEWNLDDLYEGPDDPRIESELEETQAAATAFRERYRGKLAELSATELNDAVAELERIESTSTRVETYARLRQAADSTDQARGALVQKVRERNTQIETELLFFDLEWSALDDDVAERLLGDPALEHYAQVLRSQRRYKPHQLSEPEEKISAEKSLTGVSAWGRLFNELVSDLRVSYEGSDLSLDEALAKLARETSQEERGRVAAAVTETLRPGVRTRGYVLNTILNERAIEDRLRDYETWISARNLANEIPDEAAQSLVDAIQARYDIPAALLRAEGAAARAPAAEGLRPLRAALRGRRHDRLGRGARDRARCLQRLLGAGGRHHRRLLREGLDRRRPAAREDARRLLRHDRPRRAPVRADELRRRAAERAHARARARARPPRVARPGPRPPERAHAA